MKHRFQEGNKFGPKDRTKNLGKYAQKGSIPWNKGLKGVQEGTWAGKKRPEHSGENHPFFGKKRENVSGKKHWSYGKKMNEETKRKISMTKQNVTKEEWKGFSTTERHRLMRLKKYVLWRTAIFMNDDYTCQICNVRGGKLEADHIKPWALYPELRYAIDNGRTLCIECHRQTDTWGRRIMYRKAGEELRQ